MGLLDDAIREHLELKRRHGGDPGEIERQEREALGVPPADEPDQEVGAAPAEPGAEPEPEAVGDATTVMSPASADEIEPPPGEEEVPSVGHEADAPGYDEDPWLDVDEDEAAAEAPQPAPSAPPESSESETPEPRREPPHPDPGAERPPGDDDVLEETPEFLQETPEHDRLWFEQKPPRDFDWDR